MATTPPVIPNPMPGEVDYLWGQPTYGDRPTGPSHYRDLPIVWGASPVDEVSAVWSALSSMAQGQFLLAGQLVDSMLLDDRISGVLETRLDALASLPIEVKPSTSVSAAARAVKIAEQVGTDFSAWVSDVELKKILMWGRLLNLGIGEVLWNTSDGKTWTPRVKAWDPRYAFWRWDTRSFHLVTWDGVVEVRPGDGHWILYCPNGYARGWMRGLVRPLSLPFLRRQFSYRDWARYSEIHGLPIKKLFVPAEAKAEDKEALQDWVANLGAEGIIRLARSAEGGAESSFDLELLEPQAQSWQGFKASTEKDEENIAVLVLGQNLTTSAKGGASYALGSVHDRIRLDRVESDAKSLGTCFSEQLLRPWAAYNYGDPEFAPAATWSTKAPDDRAKTAKTMADLGNAAKILRGVGLHVDVVELAKRYNVPLLDEVLDPVAPEPSPESKPDPEKEEGDEDEGEDEKSNPEPADDDDGDRK